MNILQKKTAEAINKYTFSLFEKDGTEREVIDSRKEIDNLKAKVEPKEEIKLHDAEKTMLFLVKNEKGLFNFLVDNTDLSIFTKDGKSRLSLHRAVNYEGIEVGQYVEISIDYTNDPSPMHAGSVVSLGYHVLRMHIGKFEKKNCIITSLSPFTVECQDKAIDTRFTRPQRLKYISRELEIYNMILPQIKADLREEIAKEVVNTMSKVKEVKNE